MNRLARAFGIGLLLVAAASTGRADDADLKAVVARALKAANADRLRAATAWKLTETVTGGGGPATVNTAYAHLPDRVRREAVQDGKTVFVSVVSGDKGWDKRDDGRVAERPADAIAGSKMVLPQESFRQVLVLDDPAYAVTLLPARKVGDRAVDVVKVTRKGLEKNDPMAASVANVGRVFLFDRETGRLLRREITSAAAGKAESTQVMDYLDYRDVDGVMVAHKRTATRDGTKGFAIVTNELRFVDKHDPKLFEKPE